MPNTVYLFDLSNSGQAHVIGVGEPFFKVGNSPTSHATTVLYFYSSCSSKGKITLDYISHLGQDTLHEQFDSGHDPLSKAIKHLNGESDVQPSSSSFDEVPMVSPSPGDKKKHSEQPARGKPESGHLKVKIIPPLVGVKVRVLAEHEAGDEITDTVSKPSGETEEMEIPVGKVVVVTQYQSSKGDSMTNVQVTSPVIDIRNNDSYSLVMGLPYSLQYSARHLQIVQSFYDGLGWLRHHRKLVAFFSFFPVSVLLIAVVVYQHFFKLPPEGMLYVEPINYYSGIIPKNSESIATRLLRILSQYSRQEHIKMPVASEVIFTNRPHSAELQDFFLDRTEVTVKRYLAYLTQRQQENLPESELNTLKPEKWDEQLERAKISGDRLYLFPVHSVNWIQADKFCKHFGGNLPSSDEWEVAARNLDPDDDKEGTLYPWGNDFLPGVAHTSEPGQMDPKSAIEVCSSKGDKNTKDVCDLGGNLIEWTRTVSPQSKIQEFIVRSQKYDDSGQIGALGFTLRNELSKEAAHISLGFRCVYPSRPEKLEVAEYKGGKYYKLGYPDDARFRLLEKYYKDVGNLIADSKLYESVGDFFVMRRKVTKQEYEDFYHHTAQGRGPWSEEINEPKRYKHTFSTSGRPADPVLGVVWYSAYAYCAYKGMRLPTVEEWERITRGESENLFPWGMEEDTGLYEKFIKAKPDDESHQLVLSMWTDGLEWTNSRGWDEEEETRVLKGLETQKREGGTYIGYLITAGQPRKLEEKVEKAGFRCILDRKPTLTELIFEGATSHRLAQRVEWPKP